jgi:hypothetical protein
VEDRNERPTRWRRPRIHLALFAALTALALSALILPALSLSAALLTVLFGLRPLTLIVTSTAGVFTLLVALPLSVTLAALSLTLLVRLIILLVRHVCLLGRFDWPRGRGAICNPVQPLEIGSGQRFKWHEFRQWA